MLAEVAEEAWKHMDRNRYRQDNQQLGQYKNSARKREHTDEFQFSVGGRSRLIPVVPSFNYWVRQHKGDQT